MVTDWELEFKFSQLIKLLNQEFKAALLALIEALLRLHANKPQD